MSPIKKKLNKQNGFLYFSYITLFLLKLLSKKKKIFILYAQILNMFFEGRFGRVIVTTKDGNENMIRPEVFRELRILDQIIQNTTAYYDDESYSYEKVCARWENECFTNDILNLDYIMDEVKIYFVNTYNMYL